jgi:ribosome-binding protein aMBF1 (putative translation factor)
MLVHAKVPRIKVRLSGPGTARVVEAVRKVYPHIRVDDDDELIDITKTEWFRKMEANHHPGITIRVYRTNRGWTLAELAEKAWIAESHLSAMENRKRGVGKVSAMRLGKALGMDYRRFL